MLIDTHCHLNDKEAYPRVAEVVEQALEAGVTHLVVVGTDIHTSEYALQLAEQFENVYATIGWHPCYASEYYSKALQEFESWLKHPKVVAIGEMGLDYFREYATEQQQMLCLNEQLELAVTTQKPVIFHCREAYSELLSITPRYALNHKVLHCYAGGEDYLGTALEQGFYFGVDGPVTYTSANALRETIAKIPLDKLLIETDAPWLTPHPNRGKPNTPAYLIYVLEALEKLFPDQDVRGQVNQNACAFYGLFTE